LCSLLASHNKAEITLLTPPAVLSLLDRGIWAYHVTFASGTYPYGMGRPRDDRDAVQDLARELADLAAQLASLKGEAYNWLSTPEYAALRHRLEDAHASVEAAAVEARRRVRLQRSSEGRER
jgi:hypothetical protein